ncbi:hypothetical protein QTG56_25515 (plasmid) [Rossellomorea sp. AcN35-11]|nr:hypothetical protein QTG56_25515 [Rossellomorea sp. AcN35-11]
MANHITNEPPEQFSDKYFIYHGTDTIEEMVVNIEKLGLEKSKCYFIKLGGWFYAVFIKDRSDKIVVGKEKVYHTKNGRLEESPIVDAKIDFKVSGRNVHFITNTLARELNELYSDMEIYEYPTIKSKDYRKSEREDLLLSNYVVILGVTFASRFYTFEDAHKMEPYFIHTSELISFLQRTKGAVAIDPFSNLLRFKDGKVGTYS